jgi:hypothetical protein
MDEKTSFFEKMKELTGKTEAEINKLYLESKLEKHSDVRKLFIDQLGLSYGFANTLTHYVMKSDGTSIADGKTQDQLLDEIYSGEKAKFRTIHEQLINVIESFGEFEVLPKKGYVSLKRKKQFAMIGPKTNSRMEVGINAKDLVNHERLEEQPKGSMCQYIVKVKDISDVDSELISWIKEAYEQSK